MKKDQKILGNAEGYQGMEGNNLTRQLKDAVDHGNPKVIIFDQVDKTAVADKPSNPKL